MNTKHYVELDSLNVEVGERIREIRKSRNLTQARFAEALSIENEKSISKIEQGLQAITISQAICIAEFANITVDKLLKGFESTNSNDVLKHSFHQIISDLQKLVLFL